jgi:hypothetical protein
MNFVVIGTDHRMQRRDPGLEGLLSGFLKVTTWMEPLQAIAEEYDEKAAKSIAQRLAQGSGLSWFNLDMTSEEKFQAGILNEQRSRPMSEGGVTFRVPTDDVREEAWVRKLIECGSGTTLVICGYVHFEPFVRQLRAKGHTVDSRVYLESVPKIKMLE